MNSKIVVAIFALCIGAGAVAISAQQPGNEPPKPGEGPRVQVTPPPPLGGPGNRGGPGKAMGMDGKCAMMQGEMDKMEKEMHQAHAKLETLLKGMNTTTGPAKMETMVAVINEMAAQSEHKEKMHSEMMKKMMGHMSEHMMQGPDPKGQNEMKMCPMMQEHGKVGAPGTPGAPQDNAAPPPPKKPDSGEEDHSAHHPPS